ncbi:MAG: hypothetical protein AB7O56_05980 [Bauldia sp.]
MKPASLHFATRKIAAGDRALDRHTLLSISALENAANLSYRDDRPDHNPALIRIGCGSPLPPRVGFAPGFDSLEGSVCRRGLRRAELVRRNAAAGKGEAAGEGVEAGRAVSSSVQRRIVLA